MLQKIVKPLAGKQAIKAASLTACAMMLVVIAGCANVKIAAPHEAPLPTEARMLLGKKQMTESAPIFVRIFKAESELEVWKQRPDGNFHHFKTYPICNWSGGLGPKIRQGDKQSPEGFYRVPKWQMNPNSKFHLSFNLGFPNAYDKAHGRTGDFLMVHGKCRSAGCYAMTDALMEEIYALAREAFDGGQKAFHVHAFPFRMTDENMARYKGNKNIPFWRTLKQGYDYFEITRRVPNVEVCRRRYHVNVEWNGPRRKLNPRGACPAFRQGPVVPFIPAISIAPAPQPYSAPIVAPAPQPIVAPAPRPLQRTSAPPSRYDGQSAANMPALRLTAPPTPADPIGDILRR